MLIFKGLRDGCFSVDDMLISWTQSKDKKNNP